MLPRANIFGTPIPKELRRGIRVARTRPLGGIAARLGTLPDAAILETRKLPKDCKALECLRCQRRFTRKEIISGLYRLETMICSFCYVAMQKAPYSISCFGKPTTILLNGTELLGYDPSANECKFLCPDSKVCQLALLGKPKPETV